MSPRFDGEMMGALMVDAPNVIEMVAGGNGDQIQDAGTGLGFIWQYACDVIDSA